MPDNNNIQFTMDVNLKKIMLVIAVFSAIGGGIWGIAEAAITIDARYMHVADYKAIEKSKAITKLENKIFALQFKVNSNKASPLERAMLERYKAQLVAIRNSQ